MAEITQKDFKQLLDAQQQTTEMLRQSMMTAEEREVERIAAEARREARSAAAVKGELGNKGLTPEGKSKHKNLPCFAFINGQCKLKGKDCISLDDF